MVDCRGDLPIRWLHRFSCLRALYAGQVGEWFKENTRPEAVVLAQNSHLTSPGYLAGRPLLVAYTGTPACVVMHAKVTLDRASLV